MVVNPSLSETPIIFLMGTTSVGKTNLAAKLYEYIPSQLISVDAAQIYRGFDIGTAKPSAQFLKKYPHSMIDIINPTQSFSAADFVKQATTHIKDSIDQSKIPMLVGGTMFYFHALEHGLHQFPSASESTRQYVLEQVTKQGWENMHQEICRLDPITAKNIKRNDLHRIQRFFEIYTMLGMTPTEYSLNNKRQATQRPIIKIAVFHPKREVIHQKISARFHNMLELGLIDEVKKLVEQNKQCPETIPAFRIVGYLQALAYLKNKITYHDMIEKTLSATRQLAKRQLTWIRNQKNVIWVDASNENSENNLKKYLSRILGK